MFNANGFLNEILDCLVLDMPPPLHLGRPWTYDVDDDDDNDNEEALHTPRKTTASCRASNRFGWENIIIDRRGFRYQIGVGRRTMTMRRGDGWLWLRSCMAAACTCMVSVDGGDLLFRRDGESFCFGGKVTSSRHHHLLLLRPPRVLFLSSPHPPITITIK